MIKQAYFRGLMKVAGHDQYDKPLMANAVASANATAAPISTRRLQPQLPPGLAYKALSDAQSKTIPNASPWKKAVDEIMRNSVILRPIGL